MVSNPSSPACTRAPPPVRRHGRACETGRSCARASAACNRRSRRLLSQGLPRTSVGFCLNQEGGVRRYGSADLEIPFPLLCMRPMADGREGLRVSGAGGAESAEAPVAQSRLCPSQSVQSLPRIDPHVPSHHAHGQSPRLALDLRRGADQNSRPRGLVFFSDRQD
jgi:hypothetical protein